MCAPLVPALLVAGTALSAGSAVMGGYQQAQQARFQAAQANQNAQLAKAQAAQVQDQGAQDALTQARRVAAIKSDQIATYAASGVDVGFGSPADVIVGTSVIGEQDIARQRQTTQDRAQSLLIQSANYSDTAAADKVAVGNAITSGWLKGGGDILSGAAQIGGGNRLSSWMKTPLVSF